MERDKPYFPEEIVFNILTRTTVEALIRFRCVCRTWLSMISNPEFIKSHRQNPSPKRSVVFGYSNHDPRTLSFYTCSVAHYVQKLKPLESQNKPIDLTFDVMPISPPFSIVGTCNGLLCCIVKKENHFLLLNPSIRKFKIILNANIVSFAKYGFVYDETSDDYKIVVLYYFPYESYNTNLRVFSLRANSWTEIHKHCTPEFNNIKGVRGHFVNGKLHWMVQSILSLDTPPYVICYDLETDSMSELMLPMVFVDFLGVYRGRLFVQSRNDIWMMTEYGEANSWKKIGLYYLDERTLRWSLGLSSIETRLVDGGGDSILETPGQYSWVVKDYKNIEVAPYIESLVSPTFDDAS